MPVIQGSFILQPRSWDRSEAAHFSPVMRELWHYLLRNVSYRDTEISHRGSRWFTLDEIQKSLSWSVGYRVMTYSKPQLTKALRRLRDEQMISRNDDLRRHREGNDEGIMKTTAKEKTKATHGIFVSIINYDFYQSPENYESNNEGNSEKLTKATRRKPKGNANKNVKNERMEKNYGSMGVTSVPNPGFSDDFMNVSWPYFAKNKKGPYKNFDTQGIAIRQLYELCRGNEQEARNALRSTITNSYQGFTWYFEKNNGRVNGTNQRSATTLAKGAHFAFSQQLVNEARARDTSQADSPGSLTGDRVHEGKGLLGSAFQAVQPS